MPGDGVHQQEIVHTMKSESEIAEPVRRQHDRAFKAELVRQSLQPGASVAAIALRNGVNANLLFKWRRDHRRAAMLSATAQPAVLLPVHVVQTPEVNPNSTLPSGAVIAPTSRGTRAGVIELEIAGAQLRLRGAVDEASLCSVLRALRQSA